MDEFHGRGQLEVVVARVAADACRGECQERAHTLASGTD